MSAVAPNVSRHEQPFFFEHAGRHLYAVHYPAHSASPTGLGVVLCSSVGNEADLSVRVLVEFARRAAQSGIDVLRFDYSGCGESDGTFEDTTLEQWVDDVGAAVTQLMARAPSALIGLLGVRLGGMIALRAAVEDARARRLILWAPVLDARQYVDELLQQQLLAYNLMTKPPLKDRQAILSLSSETVTLSGYRWSKGLVAQLQALGSTWLPTRLPIPSLTVSLAASLQAPQDLKTARRVFSQDGDTAQVHVNTAAFWASNTKPEPILSAWRSQEPLFATSLEWILAHPRRLEEPTAGRSTTAVSMSESDGLWRERPVCFMSGSNRLVGILHEPTTEPRSRVGLVCIPPGLQAKSSHYRLYVRLARRLASKGWWVFRFDYPGIGDSEGTLRTIHFDTFSVDDTKAAVDAFCRETRLEDVVIIGACTGARTALASAKENPRIQGIALLSLPLLPVSPESRTAESLHLKRFLGKTRRWDSWKRLVTFQSNYRLLWRALRHSLKPNAVERCVAPHVVEAVRASLARGQQLLFVYGSLDLFYESFLVGLEPRLRQGIGRGTGRWDVRLIEQASHTFPQPPAQDKVLEITEEWLTEAFATDEAPVRR